MQLWQLPGVTMANEYYLHQGVTVWSNFTVSGTLTDPTTVTLNVTDPTGQTQSYTYALAEITKDAVGKFSKLIPGEIEGTWFYEWIGTGACEAASEGYFKIKSYIE